MRRLSAAFAAVLGAIATQVVAQPVGPATPDRMAAHYVDASMARSASISSGAITVTTAC